MNENHSPEAYGTYTISQAAKKLGIPVHRLRYFLDTAHYDVQRDKMGSREFTEADISNIKKFLEIRKKKVTYEAIGEYIIKGNPIDDEIVPSSDEESYNSYSEDESALTLKPNQSLDTIKAVGLAMQKFQETLEEVNQKLEKIDKLDELTTKLDKLEKLDTLDEVASINNELRSYMVETKNLIDNNNKEMEQRVINLTLDLKESLNKQKELTEKEKNKNIFQKLFKK